MKKFYLLLLTASLASAPILAKEPFAKISYRLTCTCPNSEEYKQVKQTMPNKDYQPKNYQEWKNSTVNELRAIIALLESGNIDSDANVQFGIEETNKEE